MKWCLVLSGLVTVNARFNIPHQNIFLSVCIRKILSRITYSRNYTSDASLIQNEDIVVQNLQGIKKLRYITRTNTYANNEVYNDIYVMNLKGYNDLENIFSVTMNDKYWNYRSNFIIILEQPEDNWAQVTKFFVHNNLYNVSILRRESNDYTIYTFHSPIPSCNGHPYLVRMTQCSLYNGESYIFPKITRQYIRGCSFKLGTHNVYPLINLDNNRSEGLEQHIVQAFSKQYNIVVELIEYNKIDNMGLIVENYSYVEMLQMVRDNKVDGAIGGYFIDYVTSRHLSYTYPLMIDHMLIIMPKAKLYDMWNAVFHKAFYFIIFIFILILLFTAFAYFLGLFPSRERDPLRDFMIIYGFFLNKITIHKMKRGISETLIIASLLFSVFIIPYYVQALLCSFNTHPIRGFEAQFVEDIHEKYQLIIPADRRKEQWLTTTSQKCKNRLDCMNIVINSKDRLHYTMISELQFESYKWMLTDEQCSPDVYKIQEPVYSLMRTVYFHPGSEMFTPFDKFSLRFATTGLLKKYYNDLIFKERVKCMYRARSLNNTLSLSELRPPFIILIVGYFLSAICFAYEIITK